MRDYNHICRELFTRPSYSNFPNRFLLELWEFAKIVSVREVRENILSSRSSSKGKYEKFEKDLWEVRVRGSSFSFTWVEPIIFRLYKTPENFQEIISSNKKNFTIL